MVREKQSKLKERLKICNNTCSTLEVVVKSGVPKRTAVRVAHDLRDVTGKRSPI